MKFPSVTAAGTTIKGANVSFACLRVASKHAREHCHLSHCDLTSADFCGADLRRANLFGSTLRRAMFLDTDLRGADISECKVYGASVWGARLHNTVQDNVTITQPEEAAIQVDNIEVAQFIYLLLNNERIRYVIDAITSKVVLILGRFTPERKITLDAIRRAGRPGSPLNHSRTY
jgi:Pentapeptide repeats (8 copies)